MLPYSSPILSEQRASVHLRDRIEAVARGFGITDFLQGELGSLFDQTFAHPVSNAKYPSKRLQPGALPLEWSFSEAEPDALRIELQPFDPALPGEERLWRTAEVLTRAIEEFYGKALSEQFDAIVRSTATAQAKLNFGAFVGLVQRPHGNCEVKIYLECNPEAPALLSDDLSKVAGAVPHFISVACCAGGISQRTYYLCRDGLHAFDLEAVCAALGMAHRFPALLMAILELSEGQFHFPPDSVLLGIRRRGQESELKVELLCGMAMSSDGVPSRVERLLQSKSIDPFRRWAAMICPEKDAVLPMRIVSIKASTTRPGHLLNVYTAEPWRVS
jgi:hypothetical protein